jgi:hypothetical protein
VTPRRTPSYIQEDDLNVITGTNSSSFRSNTSFEKPPITDFLRGNHSEPKEEISFNPNQFADEDEDDDYEPKPINTDDEDDPYLIPPFLRRKK